MPYQLEHQRQVLHRCAGRALAQIVKHHLSRPLPARYGT